LGTSDSSTNSHFDYRTISSAEVTKIGDRYYMLYEGVRGPEPDAAGDTQFALGLARSQGPAIDGPWERYTQNPILLDLPGNVGVGHADLVMLNGTTVLYTSIDGETRSRLNLRWK
jgi:beta-xylosidase